MSTRQARTERRETERKAKKLEFKKAAWKSLDGTHVCYVLASLKLTGRKGLVSPSAGNQLMVNGNQIAYDAENRQTTASSGSTTIGTYGYDGNGNRVVRTTASGTTVYVYDTFGQLAAEYSTNTATSLCQTCYLHRDHLGSVRLITDASGATVGRHDYLPFGEEILSGLPAGTTGRGDPTWNASDNINRKFTGQERDAESGLDFFQSRYYGSALGRFTSPDPYNAGADPTNPQSWNAYAYVLNNPLSNIDPSGYCSIGPDGIAHDDQPGDCGGGSTTVNGGSPDPIPTQPIPLLYDSSSAILFTANGVGKADVPTVSTPGKTGTPGYCAYQGRALSPQQYAAQGKSLATGIAALSNAYAPDVAFSFGLGTLYGQFSKGSALDAQPKASGTTLQRASYGNYAYGAFFAGAGVPLNEALTAANAYGFKQQVTGAYGGRTLDPTYSHIPAVNVQDIVNGYNAALQGTLCHR